jgi:hypothetical protein
MKIPLHGAPNNVRQICGAAATCAPVGAQTRAPMPLNLDKAILRPETRQEILDRAFAGIASSNAFPLH